jgi:hypothetical protein
MADPRHRNQSPATGTHVLQSLEFANATDRASFANESSGNPLNAGPPTAEDVGRMARQTDDDSFWILTSHSPVTWEAARDVSAGGGISDASGVLSISLDTDADASSAGSGGGSSGLEQDVAGDGGELRVKVGDGIQRTASGVAIRAAAAGAIGFSSGEALVQVDGTTITVNGSNQLVSSGGGGGPTLTAGAGILDTSNTWSVELDADADASSAGSGGGSSGLEYDVAGDAAQLRAAVSSTGGLVRTVNGLAANVDGTTITVNGSNQLVSSGGGGGPTLTAGAGLLDTSDTWSVEFDVDADAESAGSGGGSSGLELDTTGDAAQIRAKVSGAAGMQRTASGLAVKVAAAGGLEFDGSGNIQANVDGTTITINGSNELVASGGGGGPTLTAGAGILDTSDTWSVELDTAAAASGAGVGGGSSGLEYDAAGDAAQLRVAVSATGALSRESDGLNVLIDGTTITKNGSNQLVAAAAALGNVRIVAASGGTDTTIADALAAIATASATNPWAVIVESGSHVSAPITVPSFVHLRGRSKLGTIVSASSVGTPMIRVESNAICSHMTIDGPTFTIAVECGASAVDAEATDLIIRSCNEGLGCRFNNANFTARRILIEDSVNDGLLSINGGTLTLSDSECRASNAALICEGGSDLVMQNVLIRGSGTDGAFVEDGATVICQDLTIESGRTNAIRTAGTAGNDFLGVNVNIDPSITNHVVQANATDVIRIQSGVVDRQKMSIVDASNISIAAFSNDSDQVDFLTRDFGIGLPEAGRITHMGEGRDFRRGQLVYTETSGAVFADVSAAAAEDDGTTLTLPGVAADNAIYVSHSLGASPLQFAGLKVDVDTAASVGAGALIAEYWDGSSWTEFKTMSSDAQPPHLPRGEVPFARVGTEYIRFDARVLSSWSTNDPPTLGASRYWVRFRVSSAITTAPIIDRIQIAPNRTEVSEDGFVQYFGAGRPVKVSSLGVASLQGSAAPGTAQGVLLSDNLDVGRLGNSLADGATSRVGAIIYAPDDMDTSTAAKLVWTWFSDSSTGAVDWVVRWGSSSDGDALHGSQATAPATAPGEQSSSVTTTVPATAGNQITQSVELDLSSVITRQASGEPDLIWFSIERDGSGDTATGVVNIVHAELKYLSWCTGGLI